MPLSLLKVPDKLELQVMKHTISITFLFLFSISALRANAIPTDYVFEVRFDSGPLAGTTEEVFVTLDEATETGEEKFRPLAGPSGFLVFKPLLAFNFTWDGFVFDVFDDLSYPIFPLIELTDGLLTSVDFRSSSNNEPPVVVDVFMEFLKVSFTQRTPAAEIVSMGSIDSDSWQEVSRVPLPGTVFLFGMGIFILFARRRVQSAAVSDHSKAVVRSSKR